MSEISEVKQAQILPESKFTMEQLETLRGATVLCPIVSPFDEVFQDQFVGLIFSMPDGSKKIMWILADEEGNGPGFPEISEYTGKVS